MAVFVKIAIANSGAVSIAFNFKHCFEQKRKKKKSQSYINACNCSKGIQNTKYRQHKENSYQFMHHLPISILRCLLMEQSLKEGNGNKHN